RSRVERFFHGPERLRGVLGLDQNHAGGIKPEAIEAMTVDASERREAARRGDKKERTRTYAAQYRRHEAEGRRHVIAGLRHDLMQSAAGKAPLRQAGIDGRQAKGQGARLGGYAPAPPAAEVFH